MPFPWNYRRYHNLEIAFLSVTDIICQCKKGIVILTSGWLFEFQMSEHSKARAKVEYVCVSGGTS